MFPDISPEQVCINDRVSAVYSSERKQNQMRAGLLRRRSLTKQ